jgi:hypothetical protein
MAALPVMNSLREVRMVGSSISGGPLANNHMFYRAVDTSDISTEGGTSRAVMPRPGGRKIERPLLAINLSQNVRSRPKRS